MSVPTPARRRGLNDIRTVSSMISETSNPQRKYLKLAILSMERARRTKECESARQCIHKIDARVAEIDAERTELLKSAQQDFLQEAIPPQARGREAGRANDARGRVPSGFKIKY